MAIDLKLIDELLKNYKKPEDIIGEGGLLKQLHEGGTGACLGGDEPGPSLEVQQRDRPEG